MTRKTYLLTAWILLTLSQINGQRTKRSVCHVDPQILNNLINERFIETTKDFSYIPKPFDDSVTCKTADLSRFTGDCEKAKIGLVNEHDALKILSRQIRQQQQNMADESELEKIQIEFTYRNKKLKHKMQILTDNLDEDNEFFKQINFNDNFTAQTVANIEKADYAKAYEFYNQTNNIYEIIHENLNENNYENILEFLKKLPFDQQLRGFDAIVAKNLTSYHQLSAAYDFTQTFANNSIENQTEMVKKMNHYFLQHASDARILLADVIGGPFNAAKYRKLMAYAKNRQPVFDNELGKLLQSSYFYDCPFENFQILAERLLLIDQSIIVYNWLYNELKRKHLNRFKSELTIATAIKQLRMMDNYKNVPDNVKTMADELTEKFPKIIKVLVTGKGCVENLLTGSFLSDQGIRDDAQSNIQGSKYWRDLWLFELDKSGGFYIKHNVTGNYLQTASTKWSTKLHPKPSTLIQTDARKKRDSLWNLLPVAWTQNIFYIVNDNLNSYLSADAFNPNESWAAIYLERDILDKSCTKFQINQIGENPLWKILDEADCEE